eukprot:s3708_g5.t1
MDGRFLASGDLITFLKADDIEGKSAKTVKQLLAVKAKQRFFVDDTALEERDILNGNWSTPQLPRHEAEYAKDSHAIILGPQRSADPQTAAAVARHHSMQPVADVATRGSSMLTTADLQLLRQEPWSERIFHIIEHQTYHRLATEQEACSFLAKRCFLCGLQLQRTQNVPQKALVLTNLHCTESPCLHCGSLFKTHQCPVWTQMAVLILHGGGYDRPALLEHPQNLQRCDICLALFPDVAALTQHLQSEHRLAGLSFNIARDSIDSQAACAHCGTIHTSMEGLRRHITGCHCKFFNPQATAEVNPVQQDWLQWCLHGQLHDMLRQPMTRLHLTIKCAHCSKACTRAADLVHHLVTAHSRLWRQAQPLTALLTELVTAQGQCVCNPAINALRSGHICAITPKKHCMMLSCRNLGVCHPLIQRCNIPPFEMRWARRVEHEKLISTVDTSSPFMPVFLQFTAFSLPGIRPLACELPCCVRPQSFAVPPA